jgi:eukaryotic-like serine/threonine-protein kinase
MAYAALISPEAIPRSIPRDTEEGRAFLQFRLTQFARASVLVYASFLPVSVAFRFVQPVITDRPRVGALWGTATTAHVAGLLIMTVVWVAAGLRPLPTRALDVIDAVGAMLMATAFAFLGWDLPAWVRPDLVAVLLTALFLSLRATFVPGTAQRSVAIGVLAALPLLAVIFAYYSRHPRPELGPPVIFTVASSMFFALSVVCTAIIARTVHGLRERVREAMHLGQYTLDEKLGEGGMGLVYKARHALLRRPTAIKLLPPSKAGEHNVARFEREVQLTSMLTHPSTIAIYDFGRTADGIFYYAMEYLEGVDLEVLVAREGPQPAARVIHFLLQVCGSLAEAHGVGLIHRDVKPANVIVCERGGLPDVVKVLDFGLVKKIDGPVDSLSKSNVGHIVGTPFYLSPEAILTPDDIDARTDLYAVGALAYQLVVGRPPFEGNTVVEVCAQHLHAPPMAPGKALGRDVAPDLEAVILSCLAKKREDRPASADALRAALAACAACGDWTRDQGEAWWRDRGRRLRADHAAGRARSAPSSRTVTVDVASTHYAPAVRNGS